MANDGSGGTSDKDVQNANAEADAQERKAKAVKKPGLVARKPNPKAAIFPRAERLNRLLDRDVKRLEETRRKMGDMEAELASLATDANGCARCELPDDSRWWGVPTLNGWLELSGVEISEAGALALAEAAGRGACRNGRTGYAKGHLGERAGAGGVVGTSLIAVTAFGLTTAANYALSGLVDWALAAVFILGGIGGGYFGTRLAKRLSGGGQLKTVFAGLIFVVAIYMLWKSWNAL